MRKEFQKDLGFFWRSVSDFQSFQEILKQGFHDEASLKYSMKRIPNFNQILKKICDPRGINNDHSGN